MGKKTTSLDCLFDSKGQIKQSKRTKFHPDFLRPLYQYTSSEIVNHQRLETYHEEGEGEYSDDSYLFIDDETILN